jgi:hypothetical protein
MIYYHDNIYNDKNIIKYLFTVVIISLSTYELDIMSLTTLYYGL